MNRKLLASAICASLFVAGTAYAQDNTAPQQAQDQSTTAQSNDSNSQQDQEKKAKTLNTITVTGSLIPQSQIETANPVITISSQDMIKKGYSNVYEALRAQPLSTGAVQDSQFSQGFTPGAQTISLLGLSPDFTLFLIDGRPMADYPLLYNGSANFTDLSNIPMSMVDHIDILPGNQSSIYGSSAIAGVVNIILKKRMEGYNLNYRAGGYSQGGGQNQRLAFSGGINTDKLHLMYAIQLDDQHPIFGFNRDLTSSTLNAPNPTSRNPFTVGVHWYFDAGNHYINPNTDAPGVGCSAMSGLFNGTTQLSYRPNRDDGHYCGSYIAPGYATLLNKKRDGSGYVTFSYDLTSNAELYGHILYSVQKQNWYAGPNYNWWAPDNGNYIINANTGRFEFYERIFGPEEIGGLLKNSNYELSRMYSGNIGIRGNFGQSNWAYDAYVARSDYKSYDRWMHPLTDKVDTFFKNKFLGPLLGTYYGYSIYAPDDAAFWQPLTPAEYQGFSDYVRSTSHTYTQNANLQVTNSDLFELPGGSAGFAGVLQVGNQYWDNPIDPRLGAGDFWGYTGTSGNGKRDNYAAAAELRIPIFSMLTADISGRYDHYKNVDAGSDSKATYKLGLEFRPFDTLLVRANYATAFRAPDMASVFQGPSGFYSSTTDYYKCEKYESNTALPDCTWYSYQYRGTQQGNHDLKSITAKSWGYGLVWSPTNNLTLKADYYNIKIENEVSPLSVGGLLQNEADCRLGQLDASSPTCVDALNRVVRTAPNANPQFSENITNIIVGPINVSHERVSGVVASGDWKVDAGKWGDFTFGARYNVTMHHTYQQYPGDPDHDLLHEPRWSSEFKTIANASVTWDVNKWSTTLQAQRYGSTPNYAAQVYGWEGGGGQYSQAGVVGPWIVYNGSVTYNVTPDISTKLIVQNIFDKMPPQDQTWVGWPYYNQFNYTPWGRAIWLDVNIHFGGK